MNISDSQRVQKSFRTTKRSIATGATLAVVAIFSASFVFLQPAAAVTPPDSCFAFNSGTGSITDYYDYEANNSANPACPRNVDIPSTIGGVAVTTIGMMAFYDNQLTAVTIPNSVLSLGALAFASNQLSSVVIPDSVTLINSGAFLLNPLNSVVIGSSVSSINSSAFYGCNLTSVTIPSSVNMIGSIAFSHNSLSSVIMHANPEIMPVDVFEFNGLDKSTIPPDIENEAAYYEQHAQLVRMYSDNADFIASHHDTVTTTIEATGDGVYVVRITSGYLINPASVTFDYTADGVNIAAAQTFVGPSVDSYAISNIPTLAPADPFNITTEEWVPVDAFLANSYFRIGQNVEFSAPAIAGYQALSPITQSLTLASQTNNGVFAYAVVASSDDPNPAPNSPNTSDDTNNVVSIAAPNTGL